MEKIIFSIIIAILYYGYQAYKKYQENEAKQAKSTPSQQRPSGNEFQSEERAKKTLESRPKPLVSNSKTTRPAPMYTPGKTPPVSLEDLLKQFDKSGNEPSPVNVEKYEDKPVKKYTKPVNKYVDEEDLAQQKLNSDRKAALEMKKREPVKDAAFAAYMEEPPKENEFAKMLKTSEGARKAFVLGEIFNRKY